MKGTTINMVKSSTTPQMELDGVSLQHVMSMEQLAEISLNVASLQQPRFLFTSKLLFQVCMNIL